MNEKLVPVNKGGYTKSKKRNMYIHVNTHVVSQGRDGNTGPHWVVIEEDRGLEVGGGPLDQLRGLLPLHVHQYTLGQEEGGNSGEKRGPLQYVRLSKTSASCFDALWCQSN